MIVAGVELRSDNITTYIKTMELQDIVEYEKKYLDSHFILHLYVLIKSAIQCGASNRVTEFWNFSAFKSLGRIECLLSGILW